MGSSRSAWWRGAVGACTESLGSDSGDVGGGDLDDQILPAAVAEDDEGADAGGVREEVPPPPEEEKRGRRGGLLLPPVMPRASEALALRAERREGRLILTEVRAAVAQRRAVFRASRGGGRLQLCYFSTNASANAAYAPDGDDGGEPDDNNQQQEEAVAPHGGEPCQVAAAGAAGPRVEVGAVVGI